MRRYVSLMKKGSEAGATLRDGAADLWRKGVALAWRVPAGERATPVRASAHPALACAAAACVSGAHLAHAAMARAALHDGCPCCALVKHCKLFAAAYECVPKHVYAHAVVPVLLRMRSDYSPVRVMQSCRAMCATRWCRGTTPRTTSCRRTPPTPAARAAGLFEKTYDLGAAARRPTRSPVSQTLSMPAHAWLPESVLCACLRL